MIYANFIPAQDIQQDDIIPCFKDGDFGRGLEKGAANAPHFAYKALKYNDTLNIKHRRIRTRYI